MGAALRGTDRGIRSVTDRWAESSSPCGWSSPMPHARFCHMGARDYDPAVGRWTSKDPIRFAGGTNLYVYCEGDPVNCIDTNGHWAQILVGAVVGAAASIAVQAFLNGPNNIDWRSVGGAALAGALFTVIGPWAGGPAPRSGLLAEKLSAGLGQGPSPTSRDSRPPRASRAERAQQQATMSGRPCAAR
jgi:RHS repeat-associated protein